MTKRNTEFRCKKVGCNKLLAVENIEKGSVVIRCPRCGEDNLIKR